MKYEEFHNLVRDVYFDRQYSYWNCGDENNYIMEHNTGGATGGNCWGDDAHDYVSDEPIPDVNIDSLLELVCPNITYLQYKKVIDNVVKTSRRTDREYYGNYSNYIIKTINYRELYDKFIEYKVISND